MSKESFFRNLEALTKAVANSGLSTDRVISRALREMRVGSTDPVAAVNRIGMRTLSQPKFFRDIVDALTVDAVLVEMSDVEENLEQRNAELAFNFDDHVSYMNITFDSGDKHPDITIVMHSTAGENFHYTSDNNTLDGLIEKLQLLAAHVRKSQVKVIKT